MIHQDRISVVTTGRNTYDITAEVSQIVKDSGIYAGVAHLFIHHTSASLIICENADPQVRKDLEAFMARLVVDGDDLFKHTAEGKDDMPAHIRSVLTASTMTLPVVRGHLDLGTWQGVYLWEHRYGDFNRDITVTIHG